MLSFERLRARGARVAEARAERAAARLAARMRAEAPEGVRVEAARDGVRIEGRGLRRRFMTDAGLRWLAVAARIGGY